jgi:polysaccharide biosynthesis protein PelD
MNRILPLRRPKKVRGPRTSWSIAEPRGPQPAPEGAQGGRTGVATRSLSQPSATTRLTALACFEIVVLGGLVPAALLWFCQPQSLPMVLPALVLIPLLLGLHYGFLAGAGGALLTAVVLAGFSHLKPDLLSEFPRTSAIGLLLVGMGAGEARDIWAAQLRRLNYLCNYHQTRLKQFTSDYQLLKVSHSQLERRVAGSANSLRTALERLKLRAPVPDAARSEPLGGIGDWLLEIMAEAGNLHTAAVYETSGRGILRLPSVAMLGKATDLSPFNPLLRETLRTGSLTSVHAGHEAGHEHVIAVIPLIDASGHIHGVVSINEMPFLRIHQDTFELLGVLGRHIGDVLARQTRPLGDTQGPFTLRESLQRNLVDAKSHALPAALIACKIVDAARRDSLVAHCCNDSRGLDQSWNSINREGKTVILKLLPLTDDIGVKSYLARMESMQAGAGTAMRGIVTYLWMLDKNQTADELLDEVCVVCDFDPPLERTVKKHLNFSSEAAL